MHYFHSIQVVMRDASLFECLSGLFQLIENTNPETCNPIEQTNAHSRHTRRKAGPESYGSFADRRAASWMIKSKAGSPHGLSFSKSNTGKNLMQTSQETLALGRPITGERRFFKKTLHLAILLAAMSSTTAMAHLFPVDLGTFDSTPGATGTALSSTTGNFGWIDGTDANWADTHKLAPFSFTLTAAADVLLSFEGKVAAGGRAGLNPGFSLYLGLPHIAPDGPDHDYSVGSELIRTTDSGGAVTEGSFRALTSWRITNDADPEALDASNFTYIGHAYDGSQDYGFGNIPGGDGLLDNKVSKTFYLEAGTYTAFVGGSNYASQSNTASRGIGGSITVVPLPAPFALLLSGLGFLGIFGRRRTTGISLPA